MASPVNPPTTGAGGARAASTPPGPSERRIAAIVWFGFGIAAGLGIVGAYLLDLARTFPFVAATCVVVWAIVGVAHWWVLAKFPYFAPIGRTVRWLALTWGFLVATSVALTVEDAWSRALMLQATTRYAADMALVFAITEETTKGLGVLAVFLFAQRPRTLVEGLVIGATLGIGFGVAENLSYSLRAAEAAGSEDPWEITQTLLQRTLISVSSHWVFTGIVGAGLCYAICARWAGVGRRILVPVGCLFLAIALHTSWDMPIPIGNPTGQSGGDTLWSQYAVVGSLTIGILLLFLRWARNREGEYYVTYLVRKGPDLLPEAQLRALPHGATRRAARVEVAGRAPSRAERRRLLRAVRALHRAASQAAVALAQGDAAAEVAGRKLLGERVAAADIAGS